MAENGQQPNRSAPTTPNTWRGDDFDVWHMLGLLGRHWMRFGLIWVIVAVLLGGFIINLEDRPRRPGRYRATGETVESEQMLPAPEDLERAFLALPPGIACNRANGPDLSYESMGKSLHGPMQTPSNSLQSQNDCNGDANTHAITEVKIIFA